MGDVQVDILSHDCSSINIVYANTTNKKITSFKTLDCYGPQIYQKVTHILIHPGILPKFPKELSDFFPNLEYMEIQYCKMKTITKEDLKGFTKLRKLKLDFNEISYLPGNLFEFTPNVEQLSFFHNKITKIGAEIFDKLEKLSKVDLRNNLKINYKFQKEWQNLNGLKLLIQEHCNPLGSLANQAKEVVMKNLSYENAIIMHHLGLVKTEIKNYVY